MKLREYFVHKENKKKLLYSTIILLQITYSAIIWVLGKFCLLMLI